MPALSGFSWGISHSLIKCKVLTPPHFTTPHCCQQICFHFITSCSMKFSFVTIVNCLFWAKNILTKAGPVPSPSCFSCPAPSQPLHCTGQNVSTAVHCSSTSCFVACCSWWNVDPRATFGKQRICTCIWSFRELQLPTSGKAVTTVALLSETGWLSWNKERPSTSAEHLTGWGWEDHKYQGSHFLDSAH